MEDYAVGKIPARVFQRVPVEGRLSRNLRCLSFHLPSTFHPPRHQAARNPFCPPLVGALACFTDPGSLVNISTRVTFAADPRLAGALADADEDAAQCRDPRQRSSAMATPSRRSTSRARPAFCHRQSLPSEEPQRQGARGACLPTATGRTPASPWVILESAREIAIGSGTL
jgi:hypothetical protein